MVVVAGLSGAAGLGAVVVGAVTQLDVAAGFEGGLAVVVLAVFLARVTGSLATRRTRRQVAGGGVSVSGDRPLPRVPGARHITGQTIHVNGGAFTTR